MLQSKAEWEGGTDPSVSGAVTARLPEEYIASVRRLRSLDPVGIHFAHDPIILERA
jgi:hypothetical protein